MNKMEAVIKGYAPTQLNSYFKKIYTAVFLLGVMLFAACQDTGSDDDDAPTNYTVTFELNGGTGTAPDPQTVKKGDITTAPSPPTTRTGYVFVNWFTDKNDLTKVFTFDTTPITADITLYAKWKTANTIITLGGTEYAGTLNDTNQTILVDIGKVYKKINGQTVKLVVTDNAGTTVVDKSVALTQAKDDTINVTRDGKPYTSLKLFVKPTTKDELKAIVNAAINAEGNTANLNFVDTSGIKDMSNLFGGKTAFNGNLSEWDTSKVTSMSNMFNQAGAFNQNISKWKTGKVKNMNGMFSSAFAFNQDIGGWNTANVTDMAYMFYNAFAFDRNLSTWDVDKVTNHNQIFNGSGMENETAKHPKFK